MKSVTERKMVQVPVDSELHKYLFESNNHKGLAKWEVLEQLIKQLPQSKQDRAFKAFSLFIEEMNILYPGSSANIRQLWRLISKRIMKLPDLDGHQVFLGDDYFEELRKI